MKKTWKFSFFFTKKVPRSPRSDSSESEDSTSQFLKMKMAVLNAKMDQKWPKSRILIKMARVYPMVLIKNDTFFHFFRGRMRKVCFLTKIHPASKKWKKHEELGFLSFFWSTNSGRGVLHVQIVALKSTKVLNFRKKNILKTHIYSFEIWTFSRNLH